MVEFEKIKSNIKLSTYDWFNIYTLVNDCVGKDIINGKSWESHIVNFLKNNLTKESIFVDVGSNYGWHSIIASKLCKEVYSFEPQSLMYEIQKMSVNENNINNLKIFNIALGENIGQLEMSKIDYYNEGVNIGDLSIGNGGEKIELKSLDSINLPKIDMIKIDVQGYEKFVIDGAINSINKNKPIMIVEFEDFQLHKFGYNSKILFDKIKNLDYEIYFLEYQYPSDHVCVHKSMINDFENKNKITKLTNSNWLNNNLENGITKKITQ